MNIEGVRRIVTAIDPDAKHYYTRLDGGSFTVWAETDRTGLEADNGYSELGWNFEIIRYTQNEYDPMPAKIEEALRKNPLVGFEYRVDVDPESRYIMHVFSCGVS